MKKEINTSIFVKEINLPFFISSQRLKVDQKKESSNQPGYKTIVNIIFGHPTADGCQSPYYNFMS